MSPKSIQACSRIKAVELEYGSARFAVDNLLKAMKRGTIKLDTHLQPRDIYRTLKNLEWVYIVRIFAEFESILRLFLQSRKLKTPFSARAMIDRVAARANIGDAVLLNAHRMRVFRNNIVHQSRTSSNDLTIRNITGFACAFVSRLAHLW